MKKLFLPVLAIALLAGCSKENNPGTDPLAINMRSGIAATRAAIITNESDNLPSTAAVRVWFARTADAATADWTTVTTGAATGFGAGIAEASLGTDGVVTFNTTQYYNSDGALNSYLLGFAPGESDVTLTGGSGTNVTATWTIDGNRDIIKTYQAVNGSKATNGLADKYLHPHFYHQLAWLRFNVVGDASTASVWGQITKIELVGVNTTATWVIAPEASDADLTFSTPATLETVNSTFSGATVATAIPTTSTLFSQALVEAVDSYQLLVYTTNYQGGTTGYLVPVNSFTASAANPSVTVPTKGYTTTVTLTFRSNEIFAKAQIEHWKEGASANVDIE